MDKGFIQNDVDILTPTDDGIFKSLLTRDEPESKIVLMDIISSIIGYKVVDVVILNNELPITDILQKQERLDVNCKIDNGDLINIEMQSTKMRNTNNNKMKAFFDRITYYACDLYLSQGIKGKSYEKLSKAYQITFADFTVFKDREQFINHFKFKNEDGDTLTDDVNIIIIELSKLDKTLTKPIEKMSSLEMWLVFLEYVDNVGKREIINKIIGVKEEVEMAGALLQSISKDEFERARFLSRRKFENDLESDLYTARQEGEEIGIKKGEEIGVKRGDKSRLVETILVLVQKKCKLNMLPEKFIKKVNEAEILQLENLRDNIFEINTVEEAEKIL